MIISTLKPLFNNKDIIEEMVILRSPQIKWFTQQKMNILTRVDGNNEQFLLATLFNMLSMYYIIQIVEPQFARNQVENYAEQFCWVMAL